MKKVLAAVLIVLGCTAWAGEYEDGVAALQKNKLIEALTFFKTAANKGDARAQLLLGC